MDQGPLGDLTALVLKEVHYSPMKYRAGAPLLLGMNLLTAALDVPADKSHTHAETCSSSTSTVPVLTLRNVRDSLWTISRQRTGDYNV
ncbi:hypothetical protein QQF64_015991 [Cirrhinus molitorella]|uniref:Uncharacterized protein n=1 Tax=Cirrhinus molitorella TaxID=172907 RepID=A0ABR3LLK3_9TELE